MRVFLNIISVLSILVGMLVLLAGATTYTISVVLSGGFLFGFAMISAVILASNKR